MCFVISVVSILPKIQEGDLCFHFVVAMYDCIVDCSVTFKELNFLALWPEP